MRYKKVGKIYVTSSWDDGSPYDVKLAELLSSYVMPATFYIAPGYKKHKLMTNAQIARLAKNKFFEVGGHTYSHPELSHISDVEQFQEIKRGKEELFKITRRPVTSFSYPSGR